MGIPKRSYQYAFNPKPEQGRIPTKDTVDAILDGLQATPKEKARARDLLLLLQQWKERGAAPAVMLPAAPDIFAGREQDMEALLSWLAPGSGPDAAILKGMGGVGKTALARMAAEEAFLRGWYMGGVHYVNMRGFSKQGARSLNEVLGVLIGALSERAKVPETVEEKLSTWRQLLSRRANEEKHLLLILDNVREATKVKALIPPGPHRAIITTRNSLSTLKAMPFDIRPLETRGSLALLEEAVAAGAGTDARGRIAGEQQAAETLAGLCGNLPLALRIVSALLADEPDRSVQDLVDQLTDRQQRLRNLRYPEAGLEVRATLELSYEHLEEEQRRAFHLCAVVPGVDFSTESSQSLLAGPSRHLLAELARAHLLQAAGKERWQFHDLVQLFAMDPNGSDAWASERTAALDRLFRHMAIRATFAEQHRNPSEAQELNEVMEDADRSLDFTDKSEATQWLEREARSVVACATSPAAEQSILPLTAFQMLPLFLLEHNRASEFLALTSIFATGKRSVNLRWDFRLAHAQALLKMGQSAEARKFLSGVVKNFEAENVSAEGRSATYRALSDAALREMKLDEAFQYAEKAVLCVSTPFALGLALISAAHVARAVPNWDLAVEWGRMAEEQLAAPGNEAYRVVAQQAKGEAMLGQALNLRADLDPGIYVLRRVLFDRNVKRWAVPGIHYQMAAALHTGNRCREARKEFERAAKKFRDVGQPLNAVASLFDHGMCHLQDGDHSLGESECRQAVLEARNMQEKELAENMEFAIEDIGKNLGRKSLFGLPDSEQIVF
ncbi:NB-ARC domain-containing protein [Streptomyces sp. NPDC056708]|uniref:NB-ARC domain-containing protein n=1 Tax=unclassified Streptomyces TaxID=2593676 RepID=UPI0036C0101C